MIGANRLLHELDNMHRLEAELMSELKNVRLVRLLHKFSFINKQPIISSLALGLPVRPRWSETGERYVIKLFRDYVFHQVDGNGNPVINLSSMLAQTNVLCSFPAMSRAVSL
ncbi:hypothetical protein BD769DRAFT_1535458 [Suillus cothurnatus]|nr:hypothetical protein BD769DRAFT_1535458 [Suillus cothurnatus]